MAFQVRRSRSWYARMDVDTATVWNCRLTMGSADPELAVNQKGSGT